MEIPFTFSFIVQQAGRLPATTVCVNVISGLSLLVSYSASRGVLSFVSPSRQKTQHLICHTQLGAKPNQYATRPLLTQLKCNNYITTNFIEDRKHNSRAECKKSYKAALKRLMKDGWEGKVRHWLMTKYKLSLQQTM